MVTALGCFGGDFNRDNGLLLSFSYKVSDILSDKFSGLCMQARKTLTRSSCEGGSDHTATVTHRASKGGVAPAPAQFGVFFCVTFLILLSFISWSSQDLCASQGEEEGEDEAEVRNSYLLHLLRPNSHRAHRKNFLVGLERPAIHFGHGTLCKRGVAPAQLGAIPRPSCPFRPAQLPLLSRFARSPW